MTETTSGDTMRPDAPRNPDDKMSRIMYATSGFLFGFVLGAMCGFVIFKILFGC
jgi:hypothetical protein